MTEAIWISWHNSRRSSELSRRLGVRLCAIQIEAHPFLRHGASAVWTVLVLTWHRPRRVWVQYSFLLLVLLALYKKARRGQVTILCDCHTKALKRTVHGVGSRFFSAIKNWSFRHVDLAIVSNEGLLAECDSLGVKACVLPDSIPDLDGQWRPQVSGGYVVHVGSFAADEPMAVLAEAAGLLPKMLPILCTGRPPDDTEVSSLAPLQLTGFLDEEDFLRLIAGAACVISLTTEENCVVCAGYEAMALGIPLVVSDHLALRSYFGSAAIYVDNNPVALAQGIMEACKNGELMSRRLAELRVQKMKAFREDFDNLVSLVRQLDGRWAAECMTSKD